MTISNKKETHECKEVYCRGVCKRCYERLLYQKNKKRYYQRSREWVKKNKQRVDKNQQLWREKNKEKVKEYHERDLLRNGQRRRLIEKSWFADSYYNSRARAKKLRLACDVKKKDFLQIIESCGKKCFYCSETCPLGLDRVDNNKGYTKDNVVPCCRRCNTIKGDFFSKEEMIKIANLVIKPKLNHEKM